MQLIRPLSRLPGFVADTIRFKRRKPVLPRMLTYTVTFQCNARCIMCDSWKMTNEGDLRIDEVERIFRQLPKLDFVRLTGGEPFVRKDFPTIVLLAADLLKPLSLHITTNGFLTDRIVSLCESRNRKTPLQLLVSLDGVGDKHNQIRGSSIAYASATETLIRLAPQARKLNLDLAVNQTIVDADGVEQYKKLREMLTPHGIRHQVVMAYDVSATYSLERQVDLAPKELGQFSTFGEFSPTDLENLMDEVHADLKKQKWWARLAKRYYLDGIKQRLFANANQDGLYNPPCVALNAHLRIFPNGDVPTCQFNSKTIGNLRSLSFQDVWTGLLSNQQRDWVAKCAGCWAECEVLPNAIYSLDLLRPKRRKHIAVSTSAENLKGFQPAFADESCSSSSLPIVTLEELRV
jgi:MoaA/NifB/PqqE/SkfB family radical SAM enzyme